MKKLNSDIARTLRFDAKMIKEVRAKAKELKETYKPEIAAKTILKEINAIKSRRENNKQLINGLIDSEIKKVRESHENQYRSEGHQATIYNILKMLELRNFKVSEEQFKNLVAPLVKADDYITLDMLGDVMDSKGQHELSFYCKQNAEANEIESTEKVMNAIKEYINTDILKSVGGDPIKFKNSSYEEIYILAENLGYDMVDMDKEFAGSDIIVDKDGFIQRQIDIGLGNPVEAAIFNINDRNDIEKQLVGDANSIEMA
jgi:hypothetical protein